jgi:AMP nucleosidase
MARYILGMTQANRSPPPPAPILAELTARYDAACARLRADIARYIADGTFPMRARAQGAYCYPELRLHFAASAMAPPPAAPLAA